MKIACKEAGWFFLCFMLKNIFPEERRSYMRGKSGGIQGTRTRVIRGVLLLLPSDARYESLFISLLRREDSVFF